MTMPKSETDRRTPAGSSEHRVPAAARPTSRRRPLLKFRPPQTRTNEFRRNSLLWLAGIVLIAVPLLTLVDVPIARFFYRQPVPRDLSRVLDALAVYGQGTGTVAAIVAVAVLSRRRRWRVPRLATMAAGGGAVATLVKMFVLRPRPNELRIESSNSDYAWAWSFDWTLEQIAAFDAATRAFPSATVATAAALTVGFWVVVPKVRWFATALCLATIVQRLDHGAHFTSDLFGSAAIGLGWSFVCLHPKLMGGIFDRFEDVSRRGPRTGGGDASDVSTAASSGVGRDDVAKAA